MGKLALNIILKLLITTTGTLHKRHSKIKIYKNNSKES